ncbi:DUF423 domain-containing protein [Marinicrinis sediminis]|uniref:DUF423 domain-containing protein n=1 Tax=Marinicrinis sediminis TaxID=1652465 RepID=A0ABW5R8L7_9BACL
MNKQWWITGSILMALSVALGAFGAHGLESRLSEEDLSTYDTAVHYHMVHALGLILLGILTKPADPAASAKWAGRLFVLGILFFSGSLYVLSISGWKMLGAVAPLGGLSFIGAWVLTARYAWKRI